MLMSAEVLVKDCPACSERIAFEALKCKHCGEFLQTCPSCGKETARGFFKCHSCSYSFTAIESAIVPYRDSSVIPANLSTSPTIAPPLPLSEEASRHTLDAFGVKRVVKNVMVSPSSEFEMKRALASTQSFIGAAFLSWILYYIGFYIVGLIVNLSYLSNANEIQRQTGVYPNGKGCLTLLLLVHFWLPIIAILFFLVAGSAIFSGR